MFSRSKCNEVAAEAQRILRAHFGDQFQIDTKGGTWSGGSYTMKMEFAEMGQDGVANTREVQDFCRLAERYGLDEADLGKEFGGGSGRRFKVCGVKPKSHTYPILGARLDANGREDGKVFKFPAHHVASQLHPDRPPPRPLPRRSRRGGPVFTR